MNRRIPGILSLPGPGLWLKFALMLSLLPCAAAPVVATGPELAAPETPREMYNAGTRKLAEGKLRDAETLFESALGSQNEDLQPPSLYNLGHVRFQAGAEELKKGPAAGPAVRSGQEAARLAGEVLNALNEALAGNEIVGMLAAYLSGSIARRDLRESATTIRHALESHRAALRLWQRALDDFRSVLELQPENADARKNAEIMEQHIARLLRQIQQLQDASAEMGKKRVEIGQKMRALRGLIPDALAPPGAGGDEEEDDESFGSEPGRREPPSRSGGQNDLTPEQAGWLLDAFRLGGDRRLPIGAGDEGKPSSKPRKTW
jgi:tetratricopeptide (TPR) repeat protein